MTDEKIRAAVEIAQKAIELAHRVPPEGLRKSNELMTLAHAVVELSAELAALKKKMRWRKYEDEPLSLADGNILLYYKSYEGEDIFVMGDARELEEQYAGVWGVSLSSRQVYKLNIHWRPLDLPEEGKAE